MKDAISKSRGLVRDLVYHVRHRDHKTAHLRLSEVLRTSLHHRIEYIVFTRSLEEPLPAMDARLPITYRVVDLDALSYLRDAVPPSEFEYFSKRLARGRMGMLALHQDRVAAYIWAAGELDFETDNLELRLGPGDVYLDDAHTLPAYRRQGIYSALHMRQLRYVQERGFKRAVVIVAVDNVAPLKVVRRIGYQEADRLSFRRTLFERDYRYHNGKF